MSGAQDLPEGVVAAPQGTPVSELKLENVSGLAGTPVGAILTDALKDMAAIPASSPYPIGDAPVPAARPLFKPLPERVPFKPAFDRLLLEPVDPRTRSAGGIHMVETPTFLMGRVIAIGDGILLQSGAFEVGPFSVGQVVAYQPLPGTFHRMPIGGTTYWVVQMSSIIGAFPDEVLPSIVQEPEPEKVTQVIAPAFTGGEEAPAPDEENDER